MAIKNKHFTDLIRIYKNRSDMKATEMAAWQCSYKKPTELLHSRLFGFIAPSASRTLRAVHAQQDLTIWSTTRGAAECNDLSLQVLD